MDDQDILSITRPHPRLLLLYVLRAVIFPLGLVVLPYRYFRYHTMRYRFDAEGISMSWGILFRREIHLTYARIQDIHLTSGVLQRWLGLANLEVQTASSSAGAEMMIEGLLQYERVRDFLYARMRGARGEERAPDASASLDGAATLAALQEIGAELRRAREALERVKAAS